MKAEWADTLWAGLLGGALSAMVGYVLFGAVWGWTQGESLAYFHRVVFLDSPLYKDRILSICVLSIVPAFHLAYRRQWDRFALGTLLVMILIVLYIVFLQYGE